VSKMTQELSSTLVALQRELTKAGEELDQRPGAFSPSYVIGFVSMLVENALVEAYELWADDTTPSIEDLSDVEPQEVEADCG